jgi:hypothetical protein
MHAYIIYPSSLLVALFPANLDDYRPTYHLRSRIFNITHIHIKISAGMSSNDYVRLVGDNWVSLDAI